MANEYLVNSADLTSVANAIRTKGETSAQLVFPSGFMSAIENIKGGAELNFEVVGGTTKPSNPKPNTIWVNTSTAITSWAFSADEPTAPVSGMVWIISYPMGDVYFNALQDDAIQIYPLGAQQYINGAWKPLTASIFKNGNWSYLFADFVAGGVLNAAFTKDQSYNSITQQNGYVKFESGLNHTGIFTLTAPVDLTHFNTLYIDILNGTSYYRAGKTALICVGKNRPYSSDSSSSVTNIDSYTHFVNDTTVGEYTGFSGEFFLDVSDLSGEYYVGFAIQGTGKASHFVNVKHFGLR